MPVYILGYKLYFRWTKILLKMDMLNDSSSLEKDLMNQYVVGMTAFSIGVVFNLLSAFLIVTSGMLKKISVGIYILVMVMVDTIYLITHTTMFQFYSKWIHLDIFQEAGDSVILCQIWSFLEEFATYFRHLLIVVILVDRYLNVSGKVISKDLRKYVLPVLFVSVIVSTALAAFWAYQVKEILPDPYQFGKCLIAPPSAPDKSSTWFWMELFVHIVYPDVILNVACLVTLGILSWCVYNREEIVVEYNSYNLTKGIIALGCAHLLFQIPYLVVNCIFLYVNARWDVYDFSSKVQSNLVHASHVTFEVKDFLYAVNFFILIFVKQFRRVLCKP